MGRRRVLRSRRPLGFQGLRCPLLLVRLLPSLPVLSLDVGGWGRQRSGRRGLRPRRTAALVTPSTALAAALSIARKRRRKRKRRRPASAAARIAPRVSAALMAAAATASAPAALATASAARIGGRHARRHGRTGGHSTDE